LSHDVRRHIRIAIFGEITIRRATDETRIAGGIEPTPRLAGRRDLRGLRLTATAAAATTTILTAAAAAATLLMFAPWSASASAAMPASVAPIVEVAAISAVATIISVPPVAAITTIALRVSTGILLLGRRRSGVSAVIVASEFAGGGDRWSVRATGAFRGARRRCRCFGHGWCGRLFSSAR
jgi:hypothetical protein